MSQVFTDELHAEKLAEMCTQPSRGLVYFTKCPMRLIHVQRDESFCPLNITRCKWVGPEEWLEYLRRWPGHQKGLNLKDIRGDL